MKRKMAKWGWMIALLMILAFIWGNSMLKAENSSELSGGLFELIKTLPWIGKISVINEALLRKMAHFGEFFLLSAALYGAYRGRISKWTHLLVGLGVALIDETIQLSSSGRAAQVRDVWIDFAGFCTGMLCILVVHRVKAYIRRRRENVKSSSGD